MSHRVAPTLRVLVVARAAVTKVHGFTSALAAARATCNDAADLAYADAVSGILAELLRRLDAGVAAGERGAQCPRRRPWPKLTSAGDARITSACLRAGKELWRALLQAHVDANAAAGQFTMTTPWSW